jgi:hypothetical protein
MHDISDYLTADQALADSASTMVREMTSLTA